MPTDQPRDLLTRSDVAALLGLPLRQLTYWVWALSSDRRYQTFEIQRRGNDLPRLISAPIKPIKDIQRRLAVELARHYSAPSHVHGFVRTRGPESNALTHRKQTWVLRVDIADFFPSINFGRVRGMLMAYPFEYPHDVATLLAQICCHNNQLPQGAPTSPIVSNLICRRLDKELTALAISERCYYSRYADDMCVSTDRTVFPAHLGHISDGDSKAGPALERIIGNNGFHLNSGKTRLMRYTQRQRVTGLVVNERLNVTREYVRGIRNLLHIWKHYGLDDAKVALERAEPFLNSPPGKPPSDFAIRVRGRVQRIGAIKGWTSSTYLSLATRLAALDPDFRPRRTLLAPSGERLAVQLFTEGSTDITHLVAAQRYFNDRHEFLDFELITDSNSARGNDERLLKHAQALAVSPPGSPCVFLFDTDTPVANKELRGREWTTLNHEIFLVGLVPPEWRAQDDPLCVELLHEMDVLRTRTRDGRRIYIRSEFSLDTGHHCSEPCSIPHARKKTLIQEDVYHFDTGASIGLTKAAFAEAVASGTEPFENVSFEGFRATFHAIRNALGSI